MSELQDIRKMADIFESAAKRTRQLADIIEANPDMSDEEATEVMANFIGHMMMFDLEMKKLNN